MLPRLAVLAGFVVSLALAAPEGGRKVALVVGVNAYDGLTDLSFAGNDATALAAVLRSRVCGFDEVIVLTSDGLVKPTAANIRAALEKLLKGRKKADTVLIALAGHGVQVDVRDPSGKGDSRSYPFFCPSDADVSTVVYKTGHSNTMINLNHLFVELSHSHAGVKLVLMDACRNELTPVTRVRSLTDPRVVVPEGVQALFSCGRRQVAYEVDTLKHGLFFHHVVEGLKGKARDDEGAVTWASLIGYTSRNVDRDARKLSREQSPAAMGYYEGPTPVLVAAGATGPAPKPVEMEGRKSFTNVAGMTMMRIPGTKEQFPKKGTFTMGSPASEKDRRSDEHQHEVEVSEFFMGGHEVTVGQFRAFAKATSYKTEGEKAGDAWTWNGREKEGPDYPISYVSWNDAKAYYTWLNRQADHKRPAGWVYRLPTEAEWEYTCRGGTETYSVFHFGDVLDDCHTQASFFGAFPFGSERKTEPTRLRPVGYYKPNGFGLYDMHGNVGEWCADRYEYGHYTKRTEKKDPHGPSTGDETAVYRGGTYISQGSSCRSAYRHGWKRSFRNGNLGFRLALVPAARAGKD